VVTNVTNEPVAASAYRVKTSVQIQTTKRHKPNHNANLRCSAAQAIRSFMDLEYSLPCSQEHRSPWPFVTFVTQRSKLGTSCQLHTMKSMEGTSYHNVYTQIGKKYETFSLHGTSETDT